MLLLLCAEVLLLWCCPVNRENGDPYGASFTLAPFLLFGGMMICYLVRHGQDDETIRGGWSWHPLTEKGVRQAELLAQQIACNMDKLVIKAVYTSDLKRAMQTAQIIADRNNLQLAQLPEFREVNNGDLAGMQNTLALERYPGLFWNQLRWEQCYPNGESPKQFYERISKAWAAFSKAHLAKNENVMLVTHGGVMHVILSIIEGTQYSNTKKQRKISHTEVIPLAYQDGEWKEIPFL